MVIDELLRAFADRQVARIDHGQLRDLALQLDQLATRIATRIATLDQPVRVHAGAPPCRAVSCGSRGAPRSRRP